MFMNGGLCSSCSLIHINKTSNGNPHFRFVYYLKYVDALFVLPRPLAQHQSIHSPLKEDCYWEPGTRSASNFGVFLFVHFWRSPSRRQTDPAYWGEVIAGPWPVSSTQVPHFLLCLEEKTLLVSKLWLSNFMLYPPALVLPWRTLCGSLSRTVSILADKGSRQGSLLGVCAGDVTFACTCSW